MKLAAVAALLSAGALAAPAHQSLQHHEPSYSTPTLHGIVRPTRTSPPKIQASESGSFWRHHSGQDQPHWPAGWQPKPAHFHSSGAAMPTGTGVLPLVPWTAEHLDSAAKPTKRHVAEGHGPEHTPHVRTFVSKTVTYTYPHSSAMSTGFEGLPLVPSTAAHSSPTASLTASHGHRDTKRDGRMPFEPRNAEEDDDAPQVYKVYEV